jgi:hypothetical protein
MPGCCLPKKVARAAQSSSVNKKQNCTKDSLLDIIRNLRRVSEHGVQGIHLLMPRKAVRPERIPAGLSKCEQSIGRIVFDYMLRRKHSLHDAVHARSWETLAIFMSEPSISLESSPKPFLMPRSKRLRTGGQVPTIMVAPAFASCLAIAQP